MSLLTACRRALATLPIVLSLAVAPAGAQSLSFNSAAPLKPGVNQSQADSITGAHYWYFYGEPGESIVHCEFTAGTLYGAQMNSQLTFTLEDAAQTFHIDKVLSTNGLHSYDFHGKLKKRTKIIVAVVPVSGALLRTGGAYSISISGAVSYGASKSGDPIVGTYSNTNIGLTKFKADGTVTTASGDRGTWKLFDADSHSYVINLGGIQYSEVLKPGIGLVQSAHPDLTDFQAMK